MQPEGEKKCHFVQAVDRPLRGGSVPSAARRWERHRQVEDPRLHTTRLQRILFLVMEPYSKKPFVRFHAFQSIFFSVAWIAFSIALGIVFAIVGLALHMWVMLIPLRMILWLAGFVLWLFCMFKANSGEWFQLPIIGPIALKQAGAAPGAPQS